MVKEDLKNFTRDELDDIFVNLINDMENTGYKYMEEWKKDNDRLEYFTYSAAILTRVNQVKAIIYLKNNN